MKGVRIHGVDLRVGRTTSGRQGRHRLRGGVPPTASAHTSPCGFALAPVSLAICLPTKPSLAHQASPHEVHLMKSPPECAPCGTDQSASNFTACKNNPGICFKRVLGPYP